MNYGGRGDYKSSISKTHDYSTKAIFFFLARHECLSESLEVIRKTQKGVVTDMIFYAALCAISLFLFMATFSGRIIYPMYLFSLFSSQATFHLQMSVGYV